MMILVQFWQIQLDYISFSLIPITLESGQFTFWLNILKIFFKFVKGKNKNANDYWIFLKSLLWK